MNIKIGDKVKTTKNAFSRVVGVVVCLHPANAYSLASASVYTGKIESVKIPLSDLQKII